jgi:lipase ATG15
MLRFDDGHVERANPLVAQSQKIGIQRLRDRRPGTISQMMRASRVQGGNLDVDPSAWIVDEVPGPNISNKDTILSMAYMAVNAYVLSDNSTEWEDIGSGFNRTKDIGWEGDGLRGHVYADETNSTIVIGIKGTSAGVFGCGRGIQDSLTNITKLSGTEKRPQPMIR